MKLKAKITVWAWLGAAVVCPVLYGVNRWLGDQSHEPAIAMAVGMSIMLGVINTYIDWSAPGD